MAPLLWLIMPTLILTIIYNQAIMFHFSQPSCFPLLKLKTYKLSNWQWSYAQIITKIPSNIKIC